jgi:hypothetical protein
MSIVLAVTGQKRLVFQVGRFAGRTDEDAHPGLDHLKSLGGR